MTPSQINAVVTAITVIAGTRPTVTWDGETDGCGEWRASWTASVPMYSHAGERTPEDALCELLADCVTRGDPGGLVAWRGMRTSVAEDR